MPREDIAMFAVYVPKLGRVPDLDFMPPPDLPSSYKSIAPLSGHVQPNHKLRARTDIDPDFTLLDGLLLKIWSYNSSLRIKQSSGHISTVAIVRA